MEKEILNQILESQKLLLAQNMELKVLVANLQKELQTMKLLLTEPLELKGTAQRSLAKFGGIVV